MSTLRSGSPPIMATACRKKRCCSLPMSRSVPRNLKFSNVHHFLGFKRVIEMIVNAGINTPDTAMRDAPKCSLLQFSISGEMHP